jgi:hypothetical protein
LKWTNSRARNIDEIGGNIATSFEFNFKNFDSISSKKSLQNPLPSGSIQVLGKLKIFKKITLKNCLNFIHRYCG